MNLDHFLFLLTDLLLINFSKATTPIRVTLVIVSDFSSAGGISSLSPSGRDAVDPIAELLSQLSVVRRSNPTQGSASAQLQQLQMQLQLERQQVRVS